MAKSTPWRDTVLSTGDAAARGTPTVNLKPAAELVNKYGRY